MKDRWILRRSFGVLLTVLGLALSFGNASAQAVEPSANEARASLRGLKAVHTWVLVLPSNKQLQDALLAEMELSLRSIGLRLIPTPEWARGDAFLYLVVDSPVAGESWKPTKVELVLNQRVSLVRSPSVLVSAPTWERVSFCPTSPCRQLARDLVVQFMNDYMAANQKAK